MAGGGSGPRDPPAELLERLVRVQERQVAANDARAERELDLKLKVDQKLVNIYGEDDVTLVEELRGFETQLGKAGITVGKHWWRFSDAALQGKPRVCG